MINKKAESPTVQFKQGGFNYEDQIMDNICLFKTVFKYKVSPCREEFIALSVIEVLERYSLSSTNVMHVLTF